MQAPLLHTSALSPRSKAGLLGMVRGHISPRFMVSNQINPEWGSLIHMYGGLKKGWVNFSARLIVQDIQFHSNPICNGVTAGSRHGTRHFCCDWESRRLACGSVVSLHREQVSCTHMYCLRRHH